MAIMEIRVFSVCSMFFSPLFCELTDMRLLQMENVLIVATHYAFPSFLACKVTYVSVMILVRFIFLRVYSSHQKFILCGFRLPKFRVVFFLSWLTNQLLF